MPDQTTPLRDRIAAALYDHSHPGWAISFPDLDQDQRDTYLARADAVLAVLPAPVDRAALVRACASFVRDTYSGEWADDAAATLEADADKIERGEPCSLLRLAAVLPATTNHDTDTGGFELRGDTEIRAAALREAAERLSVKAYKLTEGLHDLAHFVAKGRLREAEILDREAAELRRVADETAATETVHGCPPDGSGLTPCCGRTPFELPRTDRISSEAPITGTGPAAGARKDGAQ
ncbi:hypothetical protein [Streptomyces sp. E5N91]|uniref:hypothetical protein n=1 Tax=Streptomyces sp. E5N91 TaxID=1851996 RepID=UPI000EF589EE|nr:hypothetical protein [Streptomyces sp. E5N91]